MFDAQGNYSLPDVAVPHVLVATRAATARTRGGYTVPIAAGQVLDAQTMGTTNVPGASNRAPPDAAAAWIEHAIAKPMDVLPMDEVTAGVAAMEKKRTAIAAYRVAEAAKPQPLTIEQRVAALEAKAGIKPTP